ncbi:penicillin-binding protein activator [Sideroxydans sp. CL21]|uniref:penicillin-binding protein activator n=1 Tax=Sideroxydans sp. CL21 TaxID=2600596 RepID=UPI0024BCB1F5|nr:penicillin-binding protein activator [Sideroxydans sp. CL21]
MSGWLRGILVAALYVSVFGCATPAPTAPKAAAPAPVTQPSAVQAPPAAPVTANPSTQPPVVTEAVPAPAPLVSAPLPAIGTEPAVPHIALLLPLNSPVFAKAADAVQQGFLAAAGKEVNGLPIHVYPCNDEGTEVVALYHKALRAGAVAVAGPLTRNGVAALAATGPITTPTLALNLVDDTRTDQLYFFGLPPETEARQAAERATTAGLLSATVVSTNSPLSKRLAQAFSDEWQREGGILLAGIIYDGDPTPLKDLSQEPGTSVFLAAEPDKARLIRPYINSAIPVYATSQVFSGNTNTLTNYDLADVRFFDMPWLLQPDHPAVMIYPHVVPPMTPDMERLYALGIDSYRLLQVMYQHNPANVLPLDGVTGKISRNGHVFQREGILAVMRQGLGVPVEGKSRQ